MGRIVAKLVRLVWVEPVAFYYGQVKPKRWRYGMQVKEPGELMQEDHMSVNFRRAGASKSSRPPVRPHDGIGLLTPVEYYQQLTQTA